MNIIQFFNYSQLEIDQLAMTIIISLILIYL